MIVFYRSVGILIRLIEFLILIRILLSLISMDYDNLVGKFIYEMTEPILGVGRKLLEGLRINTGIFDFAPIVSIFILRFIYDVLGRIIIK